MTEHMNNILFQHPPQQVTDGSPCFLALRGDLAVKVLELQILFMVFSWSVPSIEHSPLPPPTVKRFAIQAAW